MVNHAWLDLLLLILNLVELKHYPFMISLNKCTRSCNVLSQKIWVLKKTKDINVKAFNMIRNRNETKSMAKQKWNKKTSQHVCKNYRKCKKTIIVGVLAHIFLRIVSI